MIPHMSPNDLLMFYKYLNNTKIYFEYGSGGSTYQASIKSNIQKIYTVESDLEWINNLKKIIINNNITFLFNDMGTEPNTWGYPGQNCAK
jgi:protein O-GlcNAc transferase